jgi:hypothetical protein
LPREFRDQHAALVSQEIKDGSTAFFVEHGNSFWRIFLRGADVLPDFFL